MDKKIYQRPRATVIVLDAAVMDLTVNAYSTADDAKGFSKQTGADDVEIEGNFFSD